MGVNACVHGAVVAFAGGRHVMHDVVLELFEGLDLLGQEFGIVGGFGTCAHVAKHLNTLFDPGELFGHLSAFHLGRSGTETATTSSNATHALSFYPARHASKSLGEVGWGGAGRRRGT